MRITELFTAQSIKMCHIHNISIIKRIADNAVNIL